MPQVAPEAGSKLEAVLKSRDAGATRARILEAAMEEFAAKGLDARVEDIADKAGANRRMAYYYFTSKEGLYLAALEATYLELIQAEQSIDVDSMTPIDAIAALVRSKFEHYKRYPRFIEFMKIENLYQARHLKSSARIGEIGAPLTAIIARVLQRGQTLNIFKRDVEPTELYLCISALAYFVFANQHTLGVIFGDDLLTSAMVKQREVFIVAMITAFLTTAGASP